MGVCDVHPLRTRIRRLNVPGTLRGEFVDLLCITGVVREPQQSGQVLHRGGVGRLFFLDRRLDKFKRRINGQHRTFASLRRGLAFARENRIVVVKILSR